MLLYRVFAYLPDARDDSPGHPSYLHRPQGKGRLDNPAEYDCWYLTAEPPAAVGEVFADLSHWDDEMFAVPYLPGGIRALGTFAVPDDISVLDLDDAKHLLERGLRPTQVIERIRPATQAWALSIFSERGSDGSRLWAGVKWWSYRPSWTVYGLWGVFPESVQIDPLSLAHPAVVDAARLLNKPM